MIVASAHVPATLNGLGFSMPAIATMVKAAQERQQTEIATRTGAETARRATLTPEVRQLEDEAAATYAKSVAAGPTLTPLEKTIQKIIIARDYDALFRLIPLSKWQPTWRLGKYSFMDMSNGQRQYVPFSEVDIRRFVFSPYYQVQPGHVCPDSQRTAGVAAHWGKTQGHKARYPTTSPLHIWPIYPGGGYPGQRYGCERYRPSRWVRMRKKVYIAAGVVTAAFLGPAIIGKVGGLLSGGEATAATGGIVGAGAKAGVAAKVGVTTAAKVGGYLATVQKGVGAINTGRTVNAIIQGEAPPPPIDITGTNFTDWAMKVATDQLAREGQEKLNVAEEARMRAELEALQREINNYVPPGTPIRPDPNLQPGVRDRIAEIQNIERDRESTSGAGMALALSIPLIAFAMAA